METLRPPRTGILVWDGFFAWTYHAGESIRSVVIY